LLDPGLYLVATPIGNLEDITLRALRILKSVDRIACEDTRQTQKLLNHFAISTPTVSYHEHNKRERTVELLKHLQQGGSLALVSDAGTPVFSDPGLELVRAVRDAGLPVFPIPGPSAAIAALVASGMEINGFVYGGFLPAKPGQRRTELEELSGRLNGQTLVLYEAPHRLLDTLADIHGIWGSAVKVVVARELTKLHEEFVSGTVTEVQAVFAGRERVKGEIVLLVAATAPVSAAETGITVASQVQRLMETEGLDERDALKRVARERGISKSDAYRELQRRRK
jgi:16S rRNA (cytidine1402-2'-O)-methyltransferase